MKSYAAAVAILVVGVEPVWADAGDCLAVWVESEGQPSECNAVQMAAALDHQPNVCRAENAKKAAVRVRLTSCLEGPSAAIPEPGAAVIEHLIQAQVSEGKQSKQLTGRDNHSWAGAVADLCRAIVAWHTQHGQDRR